MKCEDYQEMISPYLDDALSSDEKQQLEEHLKHCLSCRETLETMRMITNELSQIEELEVPAKFHDELHARLIKDKKKPKTPYKWMTYLSGVAAALMIGFVMVESTNSGSKINDIAPATYQAEEPDGGVAPLAMPSEAPMSNARSRIITEETWTVQCDDVEVADTFLAAYSEENDLNITKWQEDKLYHYVLEPVKDKEHLKTSFEKKNLVITDLQSLGDEIQAVHLVISIQE